MSAITEWKGYYQDWRGGVRENDFYVSDDALTFMRQCRREAALERIIARQARTITAREKSVLEIWQEWRIERDNVVLAREQRDDAQAFILEVLEAQGVSMPDKYYDLKEGKD